ncbi:tetratricopeptide repeat protein [Sphingomonas canadensis]|uniref:Tetratricopeptide repeat protein n=1 Tax=Sphingomonas canadensis TaxID=1219257 RepID=A0ABW3HAB0_9SPHN|nr:tetratricopeptide repeat protein [Sphingomonas canadensis]MCW3838036.1 tetratricopeptide repeat protein [Sphingomonas canadensis]
MRIALLGLALAAPLALGALPAQAQSNEGTGSAAIARGDLAAAERELTAELRIHPGRPELLLNLAAVYSRTGREAQARSLYLRVLSQDDVLMDLSADRTAGSHAIAQTGLQRLEGVYTASK